MHFAKIMDGPNKGKYMGANGRILSQEEYGEHVKRNKQLDRDHAMLENEQDREHMGMGMGIPMAMDGQMMMDFGE